MVEEDFLRHERKYKMFYRPPSSHFYFNGYCWHCLKDLDHNYVWKIKQGDYDDYYVPYCCEQCYVADEL